MLILPFSAIIDALNIKVFRVLADEYLAILPAARALKTSGAIAMGSEVARFPYTYFLKNRRKNGGFLICTSLVRH